MTRGTMHLLAATCVTLALATASAFAAERKPEISRVGTIPRYAPDKVFRVFGENMQKAQFSLWEPDWPKGTAEKDRLPGEASLPDTPPKKVRKLVTRAAYKQCAFASSKGKGLYGGVSVIWAENDAGRSRPFLANRPQIWVQSHRQAMPGERLQIFGRRLLPFRNRLPELALRGKADGSWHRAVWGKWRGQGPTLHEGDHRIEFILPDGMKPGAYTMWYHNGSGGPFGWSDPMSLEIIEKRDLIAWEADAWNRVGIQIDNQKLGKVAVQRVLIALGDGIQDAGDTIQKAIDATAAAGGGFVSIPPGTYGITRTLVLKPGVVLKGAGKGATTLTVQHGRRLTAVPDVPRKRQALVWIMTRAGLTDLTLLGGPGVDMVVLVHGARGQERIESVFLNRVAVSYPGRPAVLPAGRYRAQIHGIQVWGGTRGFTMWQCEVNATGPLAMLRTPDRHLDTRLIANRFSSPYRNRYGCVGAQAQRGGMITDNEFIAGDRALMMGSGSAANWVFNNRVRDTGRAPNGQEQFMSEAGGGFCLGDEVWFGSPTRVEGTKMTFAENLGEDLSIGKGQKKLGDGSKFTGDLLLHVASGRGLGQFRQVTSLDGRSLTVDRPWAVEPDGTTKLFLFKGPWHNLWVNNTTGPGAGNSQFLWGGGIENVVNGHWMWMDGRLVLTTKGFKKDKEDKLHKGGVLAFNEVLNCRSRGSAAGGAHFSIHTRSLNTGTDLPSSSLGNTLRGNRAAGFGGGLWQINHSANFCFSKRFNEMVEVAGQQAATSAYKVAGAYTLVEGNLSDGVPVGVHLRGDGEGNFVSFNRLENAKTAVLDETGRAVVTPPEGIQDYKATVPEKKK